MVEETERFTVVIVDALRLRRRGIVRLLHDWAERESLELEGVAPCGLPSGRDGKPAARMVILSIGGQLIAEPDVSAVLRGLAPLISEVPLIFVSDHDDSAEVIEAFRLGASGFLPTSMDPGVALQALSFILHGGTFFPPSALLAVPQASGSEAQAQQVRLPPRQSIKTVSQDNGLTSRQRDVVGLLSQGLGNKVIARQLAMAEATVKVHVRHIMRKLGASNRTQAALLCTHARIASQGRDAGEADDACRDESVSAVTKIVRIVAG